MYIYELYVKHTYYGQKWKNFNLFPRETEIIIVVAEGWG